VLRTATTIKNTSEAKKREFLAAIAAKNSL
jgi:hypothetical protein